MNYAPIALFAYNRPNHLKKTLDALALNEGAAESELYIFCDGPKQNAPADVRHNINEVVNIANSENRFKTVNVAIQQNNTGLAQSITSGVSKIVDIYGKVIVLEDDIVTSTGFLSYMNNALDFYETNERVMHISGYMYPHNENLQETFFFNVPLCWGWATWQRAWQHFRPDALELWNTLNEKGKRNALDKFGYDYLSRQLADNVSGKLKTWFVKWHASVLLEDGFTLYPHKSLVHNIGFDNTGVHNAGEKEFDHKNLARKISVAEIEIKENDTAAQIIEDFYKKLKIKYGNSNSKAQLKHKVKEKIIHILHAVGVATNNKVKITKSYLGKQTKIYPKAVLIHSIIGNYTYVSHNSSIKHTIVGKFCSIGPNFISGWGVHPVNGVSTHPMFYSTQKQNGISLVSHNNHREILPILIGNDVFIGMNVTVLDGVTIGDGAIIGAGTVVSKDIPPYAIAYGNPIEIVRYRFDEVTIKKLLKLSWWDNEHFDLQLVAKCFDDVEKFLEQATEG